MSLTPLVQVTQLFFCVCGGKAGVGGCRGHGDGTWLFEKVLKPLLM